MSSINNEISIINEGKSNVASSLIAKFGVPAENLVNDDGSLKRLTEWNLDGVNQYWADQIVSSTPNKETTPQVANITIGTGTNLYRNRVLSDNSLSWEVPQGIEYPDVSGSEGVPGLYSPMLKLSSTGILTVLNNIRISGSIENNGISAKLSSSSIASNTTSNVLIPTYKAVWDAITTRVPTTRTINGKALSSDITLTGSDINVSSSNNNKIASVINKEAYLEWGGQNKIYSSSPIDFTLNPFLNGNRLAALTRSDVSLYREISTDGDSWMVVDSSDVDSSNKQLFMGDTNYQSQNLTTGGYLQTQATAASTGKNQVRISALCRQGDNIYAAFSLNKIILSMAASSYTGTTDYDFFKLECGKNATNADGTGATWTTIVDWTPVRGYPGFDTINFNSIAVGRFSSDYNIIRFTFKGGCSCAKILGFGDYANYWRSNYIGLYGRPYMFDHNGSTTFMGSVTIPSTLVVNGYTKFNGGVTFTKNIAVDGDSTFTGKVVAKSSLVTEGFTTFKGGAKFTKNMEVIGTTTLQNTIINTSLALNGNIKTTGWAIIEGKSTLSETEIGNSSTSSNLKVYGSITATNNITANAFYESSDKNLKEDITSISTLDLVRNIQLKEFKFKADGVKRYGVIAQDLLEEGLDNLVSTKDNHLTVDYISLLCLKIAQLEEEIKKIKMKML